MRYVLSNPSTIPTLVAAVLVFLVLLVLRQAGMLQSLELGAYDAYVRARPASTSPAPPVTIVEIGERDIQALREWPVPDEKLALVIEEILALQPHAIGLDIYRDQSVSPGTEQLAEVLNSDVRIVAVYKFPGDRSDHTSVPPPPRLRNVDQTGFNDIVPDPGGIVRRGILYMIQDKIRADGSKEKFTGFSFALQLARRHPGFLLTNDPDTPRHVRLGQTTILPLNPNDGGYVSMDAGGYQFLYDYKEEQRDWKRIPFRRVLAGEINRQDIENKIVIIGTTAQSVPDLFYTPFSAGARQKQQIPGAEIHAHAVAQLLRLGLGTSAPIKFASEGIEVLWIFAWALVGALAGRRIRSTWLIVLVGLAGGSLLVALTFWAFFLDWWLPIVPPLLAWFGAGALITAYMAHQEAKQRRLLASLFARLVDPQLAEHIWAHRDEFLPSGNQTPRNLTATVMFTDVYNFTKIAEELAPEELAAWAKEYMGTMTPLVMERGGVILRFVGDAIMAAFGVPIARTSDVEVIFDAKSAVRCALAMERRLVELNRKFAQEQRPMIRMRIGINTGAMVGGTMGSEDRLEYCLHGDSVNIAARLESFDKQSFVPDYTSKPCRILLSAATMDQIGDEFVTVQVGEVPLRGKDESVAVFRVMGDRAEAARGTVNLAPRVVNATPDRLEIGEHAS